MGDLSRQAPAPRTTRELLILVLLIVLVPTLLLQAGMFYRNYEQRRDQQLQAELEVARATGIAFDAYVRDVVRQEYAIGLALTSDPRMSPEQANQFLAKTAKMYPSIRRLHWLDAQGRMIASSDPSAVGGEYADRDYFQAVARGSEWALSDLLVSRVDAQPALAIARGIRGDDGRLWGVVLAAGDPDRLDALAMPIDRIGQAAISIVDRQGRLIFRYPRIELSWDQRDLLRSGVISPSSLAGEEIVGTSVPIAGGGTRLAATSPIRSLGWLVRASRPEAEVTGPLVRDVLGDAALLLAISLGALAAALAISRRLTAPLSALREHAIVLGLGKLDQRVVPAGTREVADVGRAFNRMAEQIKTHQEELQAQNEELQVQAEEIQSQSEELQAQHEELQVQSEEIHSQSEELQAQHEELRTSHDLLSEAFLKRDQLAAIVDSSQDAIIGKTLDGTILSWNRGAERLYGYRAEEVIGKPISLLVPPDHSDDPDLLGRVARGERIEGYESARQRKDGSVVQVAIIISPVEHAGRIVGASTIARDITARVHAESERARLLAELERRATALDAANKELESFSYSVSHDLRAPLRAVDGFSQAVLEDYGEKLETKGKNYLHRMRAASQQMAKLIDDLLNLSRLTRSEMRPATVDLSQVVREIVSDLRSAEPERNVAVKIAPDILVGGDAQLLHVAMDNLLRNAWKFTGRQPAPKIEFGLADQDGRRVYFIRDNGVGFDMAYSDKLFGAFQRLHATTEFPGTGIGLATVQRIIRRHGGEVWAEAAVDQGATLCFTLPATD